MAPRRTQRSPDEDGVSEMGGTRAVGRRRRSSRHGLAMPAPGSHGASAATLTCHPESTRGLRSHPRSMRSGAVEGERRPGGRRREGVSGRAGLRPGRPFDSHVFTDLLPRCRKRRQLPASAARPARRRGNHWGDCGRPPRYAALTPNPSRARLSIPLRAAALGRHPLCRRNVIRFTGVFYGSPVLGTAFPIAAPSRSAAGVGCGGGARPATSHPLKEKRWSSVTSFRSACSRACSRWARPCDSPPAGRRTRRRRDRFTPSFPAPRRRTRPARRRCWCR